MSKKIPEFKNSFKKKYSQLLGNELKEFLTCSLKPLNPVIRINDLKTSKKEIINFLKKQEFEYREEKFYKNAITILKKDKPLGNTLPHFLGHYYVQEKASMLPPLALDLKKDLFVCDVAASPGSKTTQISQELKNTGLVLANDLNTQRVSILNSNVQRMGCLNTVISKYNAVFLNKVGEQIFDRVLVDAPCTATGTIRKNYHVIKQYNPNSGNMLSGLQKQILQTSFKLLKPGGFLAYSTCSLEPEENEFVINHFLEKNANAQLEKIKFKDIKTRQGLIDWNGKKLNTDLNKTVRIYPQDNDTEGFYIAKLSKVS